MNEKPLVKCKNCGHILISGCGPAKVSYGSISCRMCGCDKVIVLGEELNPGQNVKFEI